MNVLMVGSGHGGSWMMRGVQIGRALGARLVTRPVEQDWRWADVAVLVKHAGLLFASDAHRFNVPIVWDVLDCWRQPRENQWTVEEGKQFIAKLQATIKPAVMIAATQKMAEDIGGVYIPHHCRIGLKPTPPRDVVKVVGYDGEKKYLGRWFNWIEAECKSREWRFVVNPPDLSQVDILVAFRYGRFDGELCRAWKSGVKFVNALCAGRPIVTQPCAAFDELYPARRTFLSREELVEAFDLMADAEWRQIVSRDVDAARTFTVQSIVSVFYRPLLERVACRVAA
jgi:hypothetical protein